MSTTLEPARLDREQVPPPAAGGTAPVDGDARRRSPLRIAMIAPPWFEVPPVGYGGTEAVVASLVDGLVALGHRVVLIASGPSRTRADSYHGVFARPPSAELGSPLPEVILAADAGRELEHLDVDLVHDHSLAGPLLARGRRTPTLATMHGTLEGPTGDYFELLAGTIGLVAISDAQRAQRPALPWAGVVHNAIDVSTFPFRADKDDYLLWLGRYGPEKAPHLAIDAARAAGRRIVLAGKLREPSERRYFEEVISPRLGGDTDLIGEVDGAQKRALLAGAAALLFPIQWSEPFGLVMVEAMATGTPVVALRRGSVPEVIDHGRTGFVLDRIEEFPDAIDAAMRLDPADARRHVERNFDLPVMARGYEHLYRRVLAESGPRSTTDAALLHRHAPAKA
ncbi:glycosyltransferase family 4 protein [Agromyces sp. SYSU T00194]|uniref:glycosyltransferase family 4 protein n=1 Tax=Agromyces chitinivorans TaxID=3158560 RepID=UPI00339A231B